MFREVASQLLMLSVLVTKGAEGTSGGACDACSHMPAPGGVWNFDLLEKAQEVGGLFIVREPLGALFSQ